MASASKTALVIVVLGPRPWAGIACFWANYYYEQWGYDLHVYRNPPLPALHETYFDRYQNYGRVQKVGIYDLFEKYDRIIQIDDTCIISPLTPDLTDLVPQGFIGAIKGPEMTGARRILT